MTTIVYTVQCHCGSEATSTFLDLSNPQDDGSILIDLEMCATQSSFYCRDCGCTTWTGDLETYNEDEDTCGDEDGDDEDDELEDDDSD